MPVPVFAETRICGDAFYFLLNIDNGIIISKIIFVDHCDRSCMFKVFDQLFFETIELPRCL